MRAANLPLIILALAALIGGCLNAPTKNPASGVLDPHAYQVYTGEDFPVDVQHDHSDGHLHVAKFQIDFLGLQACTPDGHYTAGIRGGFTDMAFWGDYAFVGKSDGICILDVKDPAKPKFVAQYDGEAASDVEVSADGNYALLLTQRTTTPGPASRGSTDPTDDLPRGVIVVNVKNKASPQFESYYPVPTNGVHTATTYMMGSRQIVSIQTYDWATPADVGPVPRPNLPETQRVEITELKPDASGKMTLQRLSLYSYPRPNTDELAYMFPHDAVIQKHPITGKVLEYIAYWDAGLVTIDITDPTKPTLVSVYNDKAPSKYNAYHDVKVSDGLIAGRHITVTGPELESSVGEAGYIRVFDTSNPAKPVQMGTWTLPGVTGSPGGFLFSPHVFQLVNGIIYLGHYHGGVWVIDIHNETLLKHPATVGYYFPHGDENDPTHQAKSGTTWGAYVYKGILYATEGTQGVHVLHWIGDNATAPSATVASTTVAPKTIV